MCSVEYTEDGQSIKFETDTMICPFDECRTGDIITLKVRNGFKNPPEYYISTDSAYFQVTSGEHAVAHSAPDLQVFVEPPLEIQALPFHKIEQASDKLDTGSETTLKLSFAVDSHLPSDTSLVLRLPPQTVLYHEDQLPRCVAYA